MKKIISKILIFISAVIVSFIGYNSVYAYNSSLVANKNTVNPGDNVTVTISISDLTNELGSAIYDLGFDSSLFEYASVDSGPDYVVSDSSIHFNLSNGINFTGGNFATVTFKAKSITSDATGSFTLTSSETSDKDGTSITSSNSGTSVRIHVLSTINTLNDLTVNGETVTGFNKDKLTYDIDVTTSSVVIGATKTDDSSSIAGTGQKNYLKYGVNTYNVSVTSEAGVVKTYTLNINRLDTRSVDNTLSSLTITGVNFSFKPNDIDYKLTIDKESISIGAVASNDKAVITGDTGTKKLNYGLNTFKIKVTSEKGTLKTYTLSITRPDNRSSNNNLKSLSLSSGTLNFKASTLTYNVDVESNISSVTVNATLADSKASFVSEYGPRTIDLKDGNNTVLLKIKNEKGVIKTYTINVNKKDGRDSNADLASLSLSSGTIEFDKNVLEYKVTVTNDVNKIEVNAVSVSDKAKVEVNNPNLVVGQNTITVKVTAENEKVKEYKILVVRLGKEESLSNDNYLSLLTVEGYELTFDREKLIYDLTIDDEEMLVINAIANDENANVNVTGNENLKDGSVILIRVTSSNGEVRDYKINIHKSSGIPTMYFVIGGLFVILIILIILIIIQKKKKKNEFITNDVSKINSVYLNQGLNAKPTNNAVNSVEKSNKIDNVTNTNQNTNVNSNISQNVNTNNSNNSNINQSVNKEQVNANQNINQMPKKTVVNNPSGLTKVCSSCGRRVPYESNSCPYCLNDF